MPHVNSSFSPVAGIQWFERSNPRVLLVSIICVSVPLPGFSGLKVASVTLGIFHAYLSFSPVAGIQWFESTTFARAEIAQKFRFSPVAGIQWFERSAGWVWGR